jgi:type I restriction enzyme S subunit
MKDSYWFDDVAEGWEVLRLKRAVTLSKVRIDERPTELRYIGLENIESWTGRLLGSADKEIGEDEVVESSSVANYFEPGDVLFGKLRPYLAKACLITEHCVGTTELLALKPNQNLHGRFLLYVLLSPGFIGLVNSSTFGSKMPRADWEFIGNVFIPRPPLDDQRTIAEFLDREMARLDSLISEKERLLTLLAEKRQTLITQAVMGGLNLTAPLRDSGLSWLGKIPEHWQVIRLKFLAEVRTGVAKGRNFGNATTILVPYLRVANVQDGYLNLSDVAEIEILPEELEAFSLKKGDVLMNEGGDADKLGRGAVWDGSINPCIHQNHVFAVRCRKVWPEWLTTYTGSENAKYYFESRAKRTTNLASISATNIQELPVVMPPKSEQRTIVEHVQIETKKVDDLTAETERTINLLKERRAALINNAVTGRLTAGVQT